MDGSGLMWNLNYEVFKTWFEIQKDINQTGQKNFFTDRLCSFMDTRL